MPIKYKPKTKESLRWSTDDEKKFIDGLGRKVFTRVVLMSRKELLISYFRSISQRENWDDIDSSKIEDYVKDKFIEEFGYKITDEIEWRGI